MAEIRKVKTIPETISIGTGKNKETLIHYVSFKLDSAANNCIKQIKPSFKKVVLDKQEMDGDKIYSIYVIKNEN